MHEATWLTAADRASARAVVPASGSAIGVQLVSKCSAVELLEPPSLSCSDEEWDSLSLSCSDEDEEWVSPSCSDEDEEDEEDECDSLSLSCSDEDEECDSLSCSSLMSESESVLLLPLTQIF